MTSSNTQGRERVGFMRSAWARLCAFDDRMRARRIRFDFNYELLDQLTELQRAAEFAGMANTAARLTEAINSASYEATL